MFGVGCEIRLCVCGFFFCRFFVGVSGDDFVEFGLEGICVEGEIDGAIKDGGIEHCVCDLDGFDTFGGWGKRRAFALDSEGETRHVFAEGVAEGVTGWVNGNFAIPRFWVVPCATCFDDFFDGFFVAKEGEFGVVFESEEAALG